VEPRHPSLHFKKIGKFWSARAGLRFREATRSLSAGEVVLIRHGKREWSLSGRHTGNTDIPLTAKGEQGAQALAPLLADLGVELVLVSPLQRARRTCELAGLAEGVTIVPELREWNYGAYEGLTSAEIHREAPVNERLWWPT
jgi:probable phosphoglycerate mutase